MARCAPLVSPVSNSQVAFNIYTRLFTYYSPSITYSLFFILYRAVVIDGQVVARPMMYLALTYDHRLVDGREAVTFLKSIQAKIEDPSRLLLQL